MPRTDIQVPAGITTDGLLLRRYGARLLDTVIALFLVGIMVTIVNSVVTPVVGTSTAKKMMVPLFWFIWIGYSSLLESSGWQATVGKKLLRLRVYGAAGGPLSLLRAAGRSVMKDGPFFLFAVLPGSQLLSLLWLAVQAAAMHGSPVNQAVHDRVVNSWVAAPEETTQLRLSAY